MAETFYKYTDFIGPQQPGEATLTLYDKLNNMLGGNSSVAINSNAQIKTTVNCNVYQEAACTTPLYGLKPNTVATIYSLHKISSGNTDAEGNAIYNIVAKVGIGNGKMGYVIIAYGGTKSLSVELGSAKSEPSWLSDTPTSTSEIDYYLVSAGKPNTAAVIGKVEDDLTGSITTTNPNSGTTGTTATENALSTANTSLAGKFYPTNWGERNSLNNAEAFNGIIDSVFTESGVTTGVGLDLSQLRGIFGMPYQFLPSADCRLGFKDMTRNDEDQALGKFGVTYAEMIASRLPLLYITPGTANFMTTAKKDRDNLLANVTAYLTYGDTTLESLMSDYSGKLYSIEPKYPEYFEYVNVMTRAGAILLNLNDRSLEDTYGTGYTKLHGVDLENYNWGTNYGGDYTMYEEPSTESENTAGADTTTNTDAGVVTEEQQTMDTSSDDFTLSDQISQFQAFMYYKSAIPFYINSDVSFTDTMSNETTESMLATTVNGLSDKARELQFLLGTSSSVLLEGFEGAQSTLEDTKRQLMDMVGNLGGTGNNIFSTLINSVKTVVSGGRLIFPNIWSNSNFSKSYNITIRLTTPDFDIRSWYLNIYVPLCHLIALVLPRGDYPNGYNAPFLIKAFYKGMFNIDMGIITDMTINKGKEGGWTKDALPTVVEVQFTIQDLYSVLSMTNERDMYIGNTMQNIAEMDYLSNLCGVNIYQPDTFRMIEYWYTFKVDSKITDIPYKITSRLENSISNNLSNMFNGF